MLRVSVGYSPLYEPLENGYSSLDEGLKIQHQGTTCLSLGITLTMYDQ